MFSYVCEVVGIRPLAALVGTTIGRLSVEATGKRQYYEKKIAYYEKLTRMAGAVGEP